MNKKIFGLLAAILAVSIMLTPLAVAKPGAEKNNSRFEYFQLVVSGTGLGVFDKEVIAPPEGTPPNTIHRRGAQWDVSAVDLVELTVGSETFDMTTDPYSVDYTTTFDIEIFLDETGTAVKYNIRLTDVVTLYDGATAIGTLVLNIKAVVGLTETPPSYAGTITGYGTGALKSIHISAVDLGVTNPDPLRYTRIGTITDWPEEITNIV